MSADNFVGVFCDENAGENKWAVTDGNASVDLDDCQYRGRIVSHHSSRELALTAAHDYAATLPVLEYGVCESPPLPQENCGACWVCVNQRNYVSDDIERCSNCGNPILVGQVKIGLPNTEGWICRSCEREINPL